MVMRVLFIMICLLTFAGIDARAADASFRLTANRTATAAGIGITLSATLDNASFTQDPDLGALQSYGSLRRGGQSQSTQYINGRSSRSITYTYSFIPVQEGVISVPAVTVQTSAGPLTSAPFTLNITSREDMPDTDDSGAVRMSASVSTSRPYRNQPFFYTVELDTKDGVVNASIGDIILDEAIVEEAGTPVIFDAVRDGAARKIIEKSYVITPLKDGAITIPPVIAEGSARDPSAARRQPRGFFFQRMFAEQGTPFTLATDAINITVRPTSADASGQLPATRVRLTELSDNTASLTAGQPYTRIFTLEADGLPAHRLPDLPKDRIAGTNTTVYADPPVETGEITRNRITGTKKFSYTIVPQHAGELKFPEISVPWFNVKTGTPDKAIVPARVMQVAPGNSPASPPPPAMTDITQDEERTQEQETPALSFSRDDIITALSLLLYAVFGGGIIYLFLRYTSLIRRISKRRQRRRALKAVEHAQNANALLHAWRAYAEQQGMTPETLLSSYAPDTQARLRAALGDVRAAAYADTQADIPSLAGHIAQLLRVKETKQKPAHHATRPAPLNPL